MTRTADKRTDLRKELHARFAPNARTSRPLLHEVYSAPQVDRQTVATMRDHVEQLVPSASHLMAQAAITEAERMMETMRQKAALSAEIKALTNQLAKRANASDDLVALTLIGAVVRRAASNDLGKFNSIALRFCQREIP